MNSICPALSRSCRPPPRRIRIHAAWSGHAPRDPGSPLAIENPATERRSPFRSAFSLLELLVVIATIALLLAIVLPALGQAREEGRAAHCMATLQNAGLAMTAYLDDNEGAFWPYYRDLTAPEHGRRWWFGLEPDGPPTDSWQPHRFLDKTAGFLSTYLTGTAQDFRCPAFPYADGRYFPKFSPPAGGYGYNIAALAAQVGGKPQRIQQFDGQTADVFALADGIHFDRLSYSGGALVAQTFNEPAYLQWQDPSLFGTNGGVNGGFGHFRHNRRAMVLYLDAHAAGQPPRRPLHPYSGQGSGLVANLSDDLLRVRQVTGAGRTLAIDLIYGLK